MATIHFGTATTLAAIPKADISNGDIGYIWLNSFSRKMVYDSTATDATDTSNHPYYVRPDDYASAGVWIEDVGAEQPEVWDGYQIKTGAIQSTNCTTATGSQYDLDNATIKLGGIQVDAAGSYAGTFLGLDSGAYKFYTGDGANKYFKFDGTNISWRGANTSLSTAGVFTATNAVLTGSITATTGAVGGWNVNSGNLYGLASGTPATSPSDGIVLKSGSSAVISVYENTEKRVELGYLSSGIYGIKTYAANGTTTIFEVSDTQQTIAGWTIDENKLYNGANIVLDSSNKKISISTATFGNAGVQLDYNSGTPRAYIGDGSNKYFNFDGANISWKGVNTELDTSGRLTASQLYATGGTIGGWLISQSTLSNTNIWLDSNDKSIAINNQTFGNSGVQLEYNSGTPRAYIGDGSNKYFNFDGTNISWKGVNTELTAAGLLSTSRVVATGGTIGGFTLAATTLTATNLLLDAGNQEIKLGTGNDIISLDASDGTYRLAIGHTTYTSAPFRVTKEGVLYATGASISGNIAATTGTIGGWVITSTELHNTNLWLDATDKQIAINSQTFSNAGIQLDYNSGTPRAYIGDGSNKYFNFDGTNISWNGTNASLSTTGQLGVSNILATGGVVGGFTIDATEGLYSGTGATRVQMKAGVGMWAGATAFGAGPFHVSAAGALYASSATISGSIVATGGTIGNWTIGANTITSTNIGLHSASAASGAQILIGHATSYASAEIGLKSDGSGKIASGNFSWDTSGNVAMTGAFASSATITGGTIQTAASGARSVLGANGLKLYNAAAQTADLNSDGSGWVGLTGTRAIQWSTAGTVTLGGFTISASQIYSGTDLVIDVTSKYLAINDTTFGNDGIQLDYNSGNPRAYIGDGSNAFFQFDGTKVQWKGTNSELDTSGNIICTGGVIGGWSIGATTLSVTNFHIDAGNQKATLGTGNDKITLDAADATYRLGVGHATLGSAPFRVTKAGALYATGASISGNIAATTGTIGGWVITANELHNTNLWLDATDKQIAINSQTFSNAGIQLEYNSGTPRAYIGDGANKYFNFDGTNLSWKGTNNELTTAGLFSTSRIVASGGTIGGWAINNAYLYGLASGTPATSPSDGLVLKAGANAAMMVYENTEKRVELGYLSAGIYGIKAYAANGTTSIFEISDTQQNIAGWTVDSTRFYNGANIILDSANKKISINDTTFGNDGIQLEYNSGNPRAYIGDGTNKYFNFDGTNISWKGVNTELTTAGLLSTSRIVATGGTIGGFTLATTTLTATNFLLDAGNQEIKLGTGNDIISLDAADATYRLAIGHAAYTSAPFRVSKGGALYASSATISGNITSESGTIGGWILTANELHNTNLWLDATDKQIAINSQTFGNAGIQLEYNSGNPRAYIGDGTNKYFNFDGTNLSWKGTNTELDTSGRLSASQLYATGGTISNWAISANYLTSTNIGLHSASAASGAQILIGHNTSYASAEIGLKADGSGKLASGNILWDTAGAVTLAGPISSSATITGGVLTLDTTGFLHSASKATYGDPAAGFWLGYDIDAYKFNIGDTDSYLTWDSTYINARFRDIIFSQEEAPGAPDHAEGAAGNLNGAYYYRITFVTTLGETEGGTISTQRTVTNKKIELSNIPTGTDKCVARKIYRTAAGGTTSFYYVATLNDNLTTTYSDNIADVSLGDIYFNNNTTGGSIYLDTTRAIHIGNTGNIGVGVTARSDVRFDVRKDYNGACVLRATNATSNTSASAALIASTAEVVGTAYGVLQAFSAGYSTSGLLAADSVAVYSDNSSSGLRVFTYDSTDLTLGTDDTARVTIEAGGDVGINDDSPSYKLEVNGTAHVTGEFTCPTKTFMIDHPLLPTDKILYHVSIEGPRHDLIYRGIATLKKGKAIVNIDTASAMTLGTFATLCQNAVVTSLQNQGGFDRVKSSVISGSTFEIISEDTLSTQDIAWVVMAERKDPYVKWSNLNDSNGRLIVEVDKDEPTIEELDILKNKVVITDDPKLIGTTVLWGERVDSLKQKRGYLLQPECRGTTRPYRSIKYKEKTEHNGEKTL